MDLENIKSWVAQPDVCRCCLSASGTWDVTASYVSESGFKEVYFEMLRDCYGITLSYLTEWGPSRMVCKLCVGHLRDASSFKEQVLRAEKHFNNHFNTRENSTAFVTVKVEENIKASSPAHSEGVHSDEDALADDENDKKPSSQLSSSAAKIICKTKIKSEKVKTKREQQKSDKVKRKKIKTEPDYDSDTPIASLIDKKELSSDVKKVEIEVIINDVKDDPGIVKAQKGPVKMLKTKRIPSQTQSVIENSLLRSNSTLILKNTTIVPFRPINHSKFVCLYCERGFLFFKELKTHMDSHKDITEDGITSSLKRQRTRDLIKADVSEVACRLCGEDLKNIDNAIVHLVEIHKKIYHKNVKMKPPHGILGFDLSSEQLKCIICQKQFSFFKNLSIHMNEHSTSFICHVCGKKFISDQRMQAHIMMHNRTKIFCKHCSKDFKTVAALQYHVMKEHNKTPYKCPECTETFTQYHQRLKHLVECHKFEKPVFKCDICGRELSSAGGLAAHKRYSHLKTVQFPCELCGKVFTHKSVWQRHIVRVHTGAKTF